MSSTSEARPAQGALGGNNLVVVLAASLLVAVAVPLLGNELTNRLILDLGPSGIDIRNVFLLTAALANLGTAAAVFAAIATRIPFAGVGTALAASVLIVAYERVRGNTIYGLGDQIVWFVLLGSLCLLAADLVVLTRRGLPLGLALALGGAFGAAVLTVLVQLASFEVHGLGLSFLLHNWRVVVQLAVVLPLVLLARGALGWWVHRLLIPASAQPLVVGG